MNRTRRSVGMQTVSTLLVATMLCLAFYSYRLYQLGYLEFSYLPWNLFLAWIPLVIMFGLARWLRRHAWSDWPALLTTVLWLLFLPNSFYMVSDYIHLQEIPAGNILFDAVMFTMFIMTGLLLGYTSLFLFHLELLKRTRRVTAGRIIAVVLFACSVAIYIGRDLRWNSWDALVRPTGLLFDLSNQVLHPFSYRDMLGTVLIFFVLVGGLYYVGWRLLGFAFRVTAGKG
jgi:uncharacterized membrane protein